MRNNGKSNKEISKVLKIDLYHVSHYIKQYKDYWIALNFIDLTQNRGFFFVLGNFFFDELNSRHNTVNFIYGRPGTCTRIYVCG